MFTDCVIEYLEIIRTLTPHKKIYGDTHSDFVVKDVATFLPSSLTAGPSITLQVKCPQFIELIGDDFAEAVILP